MIAQQMIQEAHAGTAVTAVLLFAGALSAASLLGHLVRRRMFGVKTHAEALHLEDK